MDRAFYFKMDEERFESFRAICKRDGRVMSEMLRRMIDTYVRENATANGAASPDVSEG